MAELRRQFKTFKYGHKNFHRVEMSVVQFWKTKFVERKQHLYLLAFLFLFMTKRQEVYSSTLQILFCIPISQNIPWSIFSIALTQLFVYLCEIDVDLHLWRGLKFFFFWVGVVGWEQVTISVAVVYTGSKHKFSIIKLDDSLDQVWLSFLAPVHE